MFEYICKQSPFSALIFVGSVGSVGPVSSVVPDWPGHWSSTANDVGKRGECDLFSLCKLRALVLGPVTTMSRVTGVLSSGYFQIMQHSKKGVDLGELECMLYLHVVPSCFFFFFSNGHDCLQVSFSCSAGFPSSVFLQEVDQVDQVGPTARLCSSLCWLS